MVTARKDNILSTNMYIFTSSVAESETTADSV